MHFSTWIHFYTLGLETSNTTLEGKFSTISLYPGNHLTLHFLAYQCYLAENVSLDKLVGFGLICSVIYYNLYTLTFYNTICLHNSLFEVYRGRIYCR